MNFPGAKIPQRLWEQLEEGKKAF